MGNGSATERFESRSDNFSRVPMTLSSEALCTQGGNDLYRAATMRFDMPNSLPAADDLLKQLTEGRSQPKSDNRSYATADEQVRGAKHIERLAGGDDEQVRDAKHIDRLLGEKSTAQRVDDLIKTADEAQHKIAEKALKDPNVTKVTENHKDGNPIETVTIERRDGSSVTYNPDGTRVTVGKDHVKVTEYPAWNPDHIKTSKEYPDGSKETLYRDGSRAIHRGDTETRIAPDGTQTIEHKDGRTEVIKPPVHADAHHDKHQQQQKHENPNKGHDQKHDDSHKHGEKPKHYGPRPLPGNASLEDWLEDSPKPVKPADKGHDQKHDDHKSGDKNKVKHYPKRALPGNAALEDWLE